MPPWICSSSKNWSRAATSRASRATNPAGELTAVENLIAKILQHQRDLVRAAGDFDRDARVLHFAHEDGVIAALDRIDQGAFDKSREFFQNRRAQAAGAKRLAADRVALALERLEESISDVLVVFAQDV